MQQKIINKEETTNDPFLFCWINFLKDQMLHPLKLCIKTRVYIVLYTLKTSDICKFLRHHHPTESGNNVDRWFGVIITAVVNLMFSTPFKITSFSSSWKQSPARPLTTASPLLTPEMKKLGGGGNTTRSV